MIDRGREQNTLATAAWVPMVFRTPASNPPNEADQTLKS